MSAVDVEKILEQFFARRGRLFSNKYDVPEWLRRQLINGYRVELEHGSKVDGRLNVSRDDPEVTIKIALAHLKESPDYYDRLERMEKEADVHWEANQVEFKAKQKEVEKIVGAI